MSKFYPTKEIQDLTPNVDWNKVIVADWFLNNSLYFQSGDWSNFVDDPTINLDGKWENLLSTLGHIAKNSDGAFEAVNLEEAFRFFLSGFQEDSEAYDNELSEYMLHWMKYSVPDFKLYHFPDCEAFTDIDPEYDEDNWEATEGYGEFGYGTNYEYVGLEYQTVVFEDFLEDYTIEYMSY